MATRQIRKPAAQLEADAVIGAALRELSKTASGRMTPFGRDIIEAARQHGIKQSEVARLLEISSGAVSQHYNRH
jgi:DNA-directed RNA polymerase specialized sigma24 family protein